MRMFNVILIPIREPGVTGVFHCDIRSYNDQSLARRVYGHYVGISNVRVYLVQKCIGYEIVEFSR